MNLIMNRRRGKRYANAFPRGWPMAAGPASRLGSQSPGIKQGCGSNHTLHLARCRRRVLRCSLGLHPGPCSSPAVPAGCSFLARSSDSGG